MKNPIGKPCEGKLQGRFDKVGTDSLLDFIIFAGNVVEWAIRLYSMLHLKKMITIKFDDTDAKGFKIIVDLIIGNLIKNLNPDEISVVRINNWFDHKWLNYS